MNILRASASKQQRFGHNNVSTILHGTLTPSIIIVACRTEKNISLGLETLASGSWITYAAIESIDNESRSSRTTGARG